MNKNWWRRRIFDEYIGMAWDRGYENRARMTKWPLRRALDRKFGFLVSFSNSVADASN